MHFGEVLRGSVHGLDCLALRLGELGAMSVAKALVDLGFGSLLDLSQR